MAPLCELTFDRMSSETAGGFSLTGAESLKATAAANSTPMNPTPVISGLALKLA